jgi:hypothetical protein
MSFSPPPSLKCREFPSLFAYKASKYGDCSQFLLDKSDCGERTVLAADDVDRAVFSGAEMSSPTCDRLGAQANRRPALRQQVAHRGNVHGLRFPSHVFSGFRSRCTIPICGSTGCRFRLGLGGEGGHAGSLFSGFCLRNGTTPAKVLTSAGLFRGVSPWLHKDTAEYQERIHNLGDAVNSAASVQNFVAWSDKRTETLIRLTNRTSGLRSCDRGRARSIERVQVDKQVVIVHYRVRQKV